MAKTLLVYHPIDRNIAQRIHKVMAHKFGASNVVMLNQEHVDNEVKALDVLSHDIAGFNVSAVVIGEGWTGQNISFLHDPQNPIRTAIEHSLHAPNVTTIPLLIDDATFPPEDVLPPSIRELPERVAVNIDTDADFLNDMNRLDELLEGERRLGTRGITLFGVIAVAVLVTFLLAIVTTLVFYVR